MTGYPVSFPSCFTKMRKKSMTPSPAVTLCLLRCQLPRVPKCKVPADKAYLTVRDNQDTVRSNVVTVCYFGGLHQQTDAHAWSSMLIVVSELWFAAKPLIPRPLRIPSEMIGGFMDPGQVISACSTRFSCNEKFKNTSKLQSGMTYEVCREKDAPL